MQYSDCYKSDGTPIRCPDCGCTEINAKVRDYIDTCGGSGPVCESEYLCAACGSSVAYWAYGSFDLAYYRDRPQ